MFLQGIETMSLLILLLLLLLLLLFLLLLFFQLCESENV